MAPMGNSKIGSKVRKPGGEFEKTVVTGVQFIDGVAKSISDPRLPLAETDEKGDTRYVQFAKHDDVYKHIGVKRRADGDMAEAIRSFAKLWDAALARLKALP